MDTLTAKLLSAGVTLPARASDDAEEIGVIVDVDGRDFITVDVNGERDDAEVAAIVAAVVTALNAGVPIGRPTLREKLATAMVEDPRDLVTFVRGRWPDLWTAVMRAGRAAGVTPVAALMDVIEHGLRRNGAA